MQIPPTPCPPQLDPNKVITLAWGVFLFSMAFFFAVTFIPIPPTGEDNAKYIVGFLVGTGVGSVITFYFRRGTNPDFPDSSLPTDVKQTIDTHTESKTADPKDVKVDGENKVS